MNVLKADLGGTELLAPLKHILSAKPKQGNTMFFLFCLFCSLTFSLFPLLYLICKCEMYNSHVVLGIARQLLVLTDGEVQNTEFCIDYVRQHSGMTSYTYIDI